MNRVSSDDSWLAEARGIAGDFLEGAPTPAYLVVLAAVDDALVAAAELLDDEPLAVDEETTEEGDIVVVATDAVTVVLCELLDDEPLAVDEETTEEGDIVVVVTGAVTVVVCVLFDTVEVDDVAEDAEVDCDIGVVLAACVVDGAEEEGEDVVDVEDTSSLAP